MVWKLILSLLSKRRTFFHRKGLPVEPGKPFFVTVRSAAESRFAPESQVPAVWHFPFVRYKRINFKAMIRAVGGLLLLGINPSHYLPQASIMFAHFDGTEPSAELFNRQEIIVTLPYQVDTAVLPPDRVLREMIVNACVHRNYGISGARIRLFIYDDRIECISPEHLPNSVTVEKLRFGVSHASNPVLLKSMDNLRYIDRLGRGFPMIFREMEKLGKTVEVVEFGEELRVVISL